MSRTVFILGAGASKRAGAPLMGEFLDAADDLRRTGQLSPEDAARFDLVFKARGELQQAVFAKAMVDLDNIEHLFATFEMASSIGRLGGLGPDDTAGLESAIRWVIVRTLESRIEYPVTEHGPLPPPPYSEFVQLIGRIAASPLGPVSVVTFNYDIALDYALHVNHNLIDYCLEPSQRPGAFQLMKLHGSLNWGQCIKDGAIIPWHLREFFNRFPWSPFWPPGEPSFHLNIAANLSHLTHGCGNPCGPDPVIVPPTWNKTTHWGKLAPVWRCAAESLADAENIIVIGYSWPETDQFFRYLYALGSASRTSLKRFWVFDPKPAADGLKSRYESLLGVMARPRFLYPQLVFQDAISYLSTELLSNSAGNSRP